MSRKLPLRAHLSQLKHQAKDALRAHAKKDAGVCDLLRHLRRFERATDDEILAAELALHEVQFALALDYECASWDALKKRVALSADPSPALERDGDAVFVPRLESAAWGGPHPKQNSVLAALEAAASTLGEVLDYDDLMAVSGAAFRLQHKWCPSAPHAKCGFDCASLGARAAGYRLEWLTAKDPRAGKWRYTEELAVAHARALAEIDQGHAVLWGSEECSLLVGYAESGDWLVRKYAADTPGYARSEDWPWYFGLIERSGPTLAGSERALHVLATAVELAHSAAFGEYASGFAAYQRWADELEANRLFDDASTWFPLALGNAHTYSCLAEARGAAARALERLARDLPEQVAPELERARAAFDAIRALIQDGAGGAPPPWQLFPWCLGAPAAWTHEQRCAQAAVLRRARAEEQTAIGALEAALRELGVQPDALSTQPD